MEPTKTRARVCVPLPSAESSVMAVPLLIVLTVLEGCCCGVSTGDNDSLPL